MENIVLNDAELAAVTGGEDATGTLVPRQRIFPGTPVEPFQPSTQPIPDTSGN